MMDLSLFNLQIFFWIFQGFSRKKKSVDLRGELCQQITQEAKRLTFRSPARVQAIYGGAWPQGRGNPRTQPQ
jgi:hypothetical protein